MNAPLAVEREGSCWSFTINRPDKMNGLSAPLVDALLENVDAAHAAGAQVLVFRGAGKNFSAGFDLSEFEVQSEGDLLLRFVRVELLLHKVASSPCLTVALAHGRNFGAGVDLFGACKWRCSSADASFRMPGLKFGLVLGTRRFAAIVGREAARGILETARSFSADEARALGFVSRFAAPQDWSGIVAEAAASAASLTDAARASLYQALDGEAPDADLARLVRSAAAPGLKDRIRTYQAARG
jgi:enoyl-CoA hydratase